jgi:putative thioredoxin
VIEADAGSFEREVLERSRSVPVLVDFWAPWCGPCRFLAPVLEKLCQQAQGAFALVKVNTDSNVELANSYGIRGIPAVKLFRDGTVVDEFVGALPESEVKSFLARHLPSPASSAVEEARRLADTGDTEGAIGVYRKALERDPTHAASLLALAGLLRDKGELVEARDLLRRVPPRSAEETQAERLLASMELEADAAEFRLEECQARLQSDASDLEAGLGLGLCLAAAGRYESALETLLEVVTRDKTFRDGAARKAMLKVFDLVGPREELSESFRRRLANVLY